MSINLSGDHVQHDTYCDKLIDTHPVTGQPLRDTMKMQGMMLQLWQWAIPALESLWDWKFTTDQNLIILYNMIVDNNNRIITLENENQILKDELCLRDLNFSWC